MHEQYPFKNSPQSLTLECEIKRVAAERDESIEKTIETLAELSGVGIRQIYNYRVGKTDIPSGLISVFCNQFGSKAMAMAILKQCEQCEEIEAFDIVKLANESCQLTLKAHYKVLEVLDDGKIDGFENNEVKRVVAASVASFHRLEQIVDDGYNRRRAA
jgi:D-mannonate dehydratase